MQGASREALGAVRQQLDTLLRSGGLGGADGAARVGDDLLAVAQLLDGQPALRRALTDTGREADDRAALVRRLLASRVGEPASDVVVGAVRARWTRPSDLVAGLEELGLEAHLAAAEQAGRLGDVEDQLFRFGRVVAGDAALRAALVDRSAPPASRTALVRRLLEGRAAPETVRLVEHAVVARRERALEAALDRLVDLAARRRQHMVATVRVAVPLTPEHRDRLARALERQHGRPVHLNVVVDPDVIGGLRVELGDEVVDGTVASRLDEARRRLAG